jgi:hypothetical protein
MKKSLSLLIFVTCFQSLSVVYAGSSDDEYFSDESDEIEVENTIEDVLLFDQIFLNQFKTQDSRLLTLAGFFSSAERMIAGFKGKPGHSLLLVQSLFRGKLGFSPSNYSPVLMQTLCEPFESKDVLIRIINQILDNSMCSENIQEQIATKLTHLRDEIANQHEVNDAPELFYQQAVHKILLFHPEDSDSQARRFLGLSNVFQICYNSFNDINTKDLMISDEAITCGLYFYDCETLTQKIKNTLGPIVDEEDANFLIKKLTELRAVIFKNFEGRDIKSLNATDMKLFFALSAQFCNQAIHSILDISVGSKCAIYYKPMGLLLAILSRQ